MKKDIKDYLHLYLGQRVRYRFVDWEKDAWTPWLPMTARDIDKIFDDFSLSMFEIALRPLSDMTDEEAQKVAMIALNRDNANGLKINRTPERNYVSIWYAQWLPRGDYETERWTECDLEICIQDDFTIYNHTFYRKGNGTAVGNEPLYRQHEITAFLLSKGFDIFNLIEAGLAIDKTKVNP